MEITAGDREKGLMVDYDPKWAEVERRIMALEERLTDFAQKVMTHEAVCVERQKSMFNVIATLDSRMESIGNVVDKLNNRFFGWHTSIIGVLFMIVLGLVGVIWSTHR